MAACLLCANLALLSGCATDRSRIAASEKAKVERDAIDGAAHIAAQHGALPDLPGNCRAQSKAGVEASDRIDAALVKYDHALGRANEKLVRCADWYDRVKISHIGVKKENAK